MKMPLGAVIFLGIVLLAFSVLDIIMFVSLSKPGDERNQAIVGKASSFTLLGVIGWLLLDAAGAFLTASPLSINPFITLELIAVLYYAALKYYKWKYGG